MLFSLGNDGKRICGRVFAAVPWSETPDHPPHRSSVVSAAEHTSPSDIANLEWIFLVKRRTTTTGVHFVTQIPTLQNTIKATQKTLTSSGSSASSSSSSSSSASPASSDSPSSFSSSCSSDGVWAGASACALLGVWIDAMMDDR